MRIIRLVFLCSVALSPYAGFLHAQPPQKKLDAGVDLRSDPRLKVPVTLKFDSMPTSEQVLEAMQKQTGVPLAWDIEKGKGTFGHTELKDFPAWKAMEIIATRQVANGKWEKSGDGYVLHGTPKDFGPRPDSEKAKADKRAYEEALAKQAKAREDFAKYHPLGLDTRLHARLTVVEKHPKLADLFERLATATNLKFTLADNLRHHDPDLGDIQLKETRAYTIMELIASHDLDDGRWEKTADGYSLEGTSRLTSPVQPRTYLWAWIGVGVAVVVALSLFGGMYVFYRRRRQEPATAKDSR